MDRSIQLLIKNRMTYYLCKNPDVKARVVSELEAVCADEDAGGTPLPFSQVRQVRVLDHIETECLRLHPPIGYATPRDTPSAGVTICGVFIPGGVAVGVPAATIGRNPSVYPQPDTWDPDRWSGNANTTDLAQMKTCYLGFGHGSRQCIGRNVADQFIQKMMAQLLLRYDIQLEDSTVVLGSKEFTIQKPDQRYNIVIKRRSRKD